MARQLSIVILFLILGVPSIVFIYLLFVYNISTYSNPFDVARFRYSKSCQGCDLKNMDFSGQDLQHANLQKTDLRGVIFDRANLSHANLKGADLGRLWDAPRSASFKNSNLSGADLSGLAFGPGDTLMGANLSETNLTGAKLINLDFTNAKLMQTKLEDADLTYANLKNAVVIDIRVNKNTKIGSDYRRKGSP
jgi:uncharacterized protein YjbI with pentapeptide repeats